MLARCLLLATLALAACGSVEQPLVPDMGDFHAFDLAVLIDSPPLASLGQTCTPDPGAWQSSSGSRGSCYPGLFCCPTGCPLPLSDGGPCDPVPACAFPVGTQCPSP
jgi:hypothetical protein